MSQKLTLCFIMIVRHHHKEVFKRSDNRERVLNSSVYLAPYAPYKKDLKVQPLFRHYYQSNTGEVSCFRDVDRLRLVGKIVDRHINLLSLKSYHLMNDSFPLHKDEAIEDFRINWVNKMSVNVFMSPTPLKKIRDYFGGI